MSAAEHIASGHTVEYVQLGYLPDIWPRVFEHVAAACDITMTPADVHHALINDKATLWLVLDADRAIRASLITRMRHKAGNTWLEVLTMGGEGFKDWGHVMHRVLADTADLNGGERLRAYCRRGVAKWLRELGWKEKQIIMEYPIDGR